MVIVVTSCTLVYSASTRVEALYFFFTLMKTVQVNNKNTYDKTIWCLCFVCKALSPKITVRSKQLIGLGMGNTFHSFSPFRF